MDIDPEQLPRHTVEVPKKRIVLLTHYYWPEPIIFPPQIAEALLAAGYQVEVVTGYPNRPHGRIHDGYKRRLRFSEVINGVRVHRVPSIINHSRNPIERIANFLSLSLSTLTVTPTVRQADVVFVYASPATIGIPAQIWKTLFGIPYVLQIQDLWPESVTDSGMMGQGRINRLAARMMSPWLKRLYGKAGALIAISPGMKRVLVARGNDPDKCSVAYNWAQEETIEVKDPDTFSEKGLRLLYAGNLGIMQDLETIVEAAKSYDQHADFSLKIAGGGIMESSLRDSTKDLKKTQLVGQFSHSEVSRVYVEADFQLVTLKDIPIFRVTVPSKLQSSLAAGVPVITTVKGDVASLILEYEAGIVAEPESVESLTKAFETAVNMSTSEKAQMGRNARRLYEEKMSRSTGAEVIESVVAEVIAKDQTTPSRQARTESGQM